MPHFVVDCSASIVSSQNSEEILQKVHAAANSTGLFSEKNVQVRLNTFDHVQVGGVQKEFIHVFASILEGRTVEQKLALTKALVEVLTSMFPDVQVVGADIRDIEKGTGSYVNNG